MRPWIAYEYSKSSMLVSAYGFKVHNNSIFIEVFHRFKYASQIIEWLKQKKLLANLREHFQSVKLYIKLFQTEHELVNSYGIHLSDSPC